MTLSGWLLIAGFIALTVAMAKPIGLWLFALYEGRRTPLHMIFGPVEKGFYALGGVDPEREQGWRGYAVAMLLFNLGGLLLLYLLRLQLPFEVILQ